MEKQMVLRSISGQVTTTTAEGAHTHSLSFSENPPENATPSGMIPYVSSLNLSCTEADADTFMLGQTYPISIGAALAADDSAEPAQQ